MNRQPIHAARGPTLTCRGRVQEAALRMLMNNLDLEVAEPPKISWCTAAPVHATRSWEAYDDLVAYLRRLENEAGS